jgi:hypothetical protein
MKHILMIAAVVVAVLTSACSSKETDEPEAPQPDAIILLDGATLEVGQEGGTVMLRFNANKDWTIEIPQTQEHFNGVLEQRAGAAGEVSVPFTALPNTKGTARSTTMRITAGRATAEITVNQSPVAIELPSEEEVREYLVRLFNDTDGPNWRFKGKWCSELPISQWGSEVKYENGRLSLILGEHNLKGDIDLSGCKALVSIRCSKNNIGRLDVSDCPLLTTVECVNTGLEEINLKGCLSLTRVNVSYNSLSGIDLGWSKTLSELDVRNCRVESLDLSECVSLQTLNCATNRLKKLEVPHRYRLVDCFCYENEIGSLDLRNAPQLQVVNCGDNELTSLEVAGSPRVRWIYCYNNRLTKLDIADKKDVLAHLYCFSNRIESLDVSGFTALSELHCSDNGMTSLNFAGCRRLHWLYCSYNRLERLDFTGLDLDIFERLDCSYNRLQEADLASLKPMRLWCQGNRIGGEIPPHFDSMLEFEHDARYEYRPATGTYTDRGYGWWYPGEPDKMEHSR